MVVCFCTGFLVDLGVLNGTHLGSDIPIGFVAVSVRSSSGVPVDARRSLLVAMCPHRLPHGRSHAHNLPCC